MKPPTDAMLDEGLMSVAETAIFLSVSTQSVWRLMWTRQLPFTHIGRARRIPRAAVKALINRGLVAPI